MEPQYIIDTVAAHLRKQGVRSHDGRDKCLYRGPNGTKCAVGCLLPDDLITEAANSDCVWTLIVGDRRVADHLGRGNCTLLGALQRVHDFEDSWGVDGFEGEPGLKIVCINFDLVYPEPTNA